MRQSTRLIFNVGVTYTRMLLTVGIGIVVTRLLLKALGDVDFGLLTALGASGSLLWLLADAMTVSAQRHMAYELGREDEAELRVVFNTTLSIYVVLGLVAVVAGLALMPVILGFLTIPDGRENAAMWVYLFTVLAIAISTSKTPYDALLNARQRLDIREGFEVADRLISLAIVILITYATWDRLVLYAGLLAGQATLNAAGRIGICLWLFPESRPAPRLFRGNRLRELSSFAGWSLVGMLQVRALSQGSIMAINVVHGPVVNAAFALSERAMSYQRRLTMGISMASSPAVTTAEGRSDRQTVARLVAATCRYATLAQMLLAIPVLLDTKLLLTLWLDDYPPMTELFVQLAVAQAFGQLAFGFGQAIQAQGDARAIALKVYLPRLVLFVLIAGLMIALDWPAWIMPAQQLAGLGVMSFFLIPLGFGRRIGLTYGSWVRGVVGPVLLAAAVAAGAAGSVRLLLPETYWRLAAVFAVHTLVLMTSAWFLVVTDEERRHFQRLAGNVLRKTGLGHR